MPTLAPVSITELTDVAKRVRAHIVQMVFQAQSGHPGGSLSAVELGVSLFWNHLRCDTGNPEWPERAEDLDARMTVEISDCENCNTWTLDIHDGHLHPRRNGAPNAEVHLKTNTQGFFSFIRGEQPAELVGELTGPSETALSIQGCFQTH